MTNFRIIKEGYRGGLFGDKEEFVIEYDTEIGKRRLAWVTFVGNESKNVVKLTDMGDNSRGLKPMEANVRKRREFIAKNGATPMRVLFLALAQQFGSEDKGLRVEILTKTRLDGEDFLQRMVEMGFLKKRGSNYFVTPTTVRKANIAGRIEIGETLHMAVPVVNKLLPKTRKKLTKPILKNALARRIRKMPRTSLR